MDEALSPISLRIVLLQICIQQPPGVNPRSETPKLAKYDKKGFMKTTADGHRCFSREFKIAAVRRVLAGEELNKVARDLDIRYDVLWKWKKRVVEQGEEYLYTVGRGKRPAAPRKNQSKARSIAELERQIGHQQMEIRFLERALRQVEERRQPKNDDGAEASSKR
jgi:transposase